MGKIYTSYFGNYKNFPEGSLVIGVVRHPPNESVLNFEQLAPSVELLRQYKNKQIDEFVFKIVYLTELADRGLNSKAIKEVLLDVAKDKDVILCCYEKPEDYCHRHILAKWLGDIEEL